MNGSIATRYANALFQEALEHNVDKIVYDHLMLLYLCMKKEPELVLRLSSPKVNADQKYQLLNIAAGIELEDCHSDTESDRDGLYGHNLCRRFFYLMLQHHRESYLRMMMMIYHDLYRDHYGIDKVVIEAATQPSDENMQKIRERVMARTGRKVECHTIVNPELIGGFRLQIGDTRYDYSYQTKLRKIKKRIQTWNR